ncbi:MAG TPA: glycerophosphodiester phosphodiesterase family protein [Clostridia bacterium]|nr:glycerophosphodiester phosphodiesterase family protein [Clostridia bacterium]
MKTFPKSVILLFVILTAAVSMTALTVSWALTHAENTDMPEAPRLIAHAGGEIYGIRLTNSLQALNNSYKEGFRFFEVDISKTSDGVPVLVHDWGNTNWFRNVKYSTRPASYKEFKSGSTILGLKLMDLDMLTDWLSEHSDSFIITDVKDDNAGLLRTIVQRYPGMAGQTIPQIYSFEEYDIVRDMGYDHIMLTLYKLDDPADEIKAFCDNHELFGVSLPVDRCTGDYLKKLIGLEIPMFAHTINDYNTYVKVRDKGIYGVYADYFQPSAWVE